MTIPTTATRDLSERTRAEEALRESEKRYRTLFDSAPMAVFVCDTGAVIQYHNARAVELWGRKPECGVEKHCGSMKLWLPDGTLLPHGQSPMVEVLRTGVPAHNVEVFIERPDGSRLPVLVNFSALKNERGEVTGAITSFIDITERKRAEQSLRESEARFRAVADNIPQLAWMADGRGRVDWFNRGWLDYTGTTLEDNVGTGWKAVHHPDYIEKVAEKFERALREETDWEDTFPLRGKDGHYRWFLSRMTAIREAGTGKPGKVLRFFGTNTDITQQRAIEQELARSRAGLQQRVEERTRELQETHERLRMSERLASMGVLSAGLGHDMGNLLLPMRVRLDSLESGPLSDQAKEDLKAIRTSADYLQKLANGLRLLALDPQRSPVGETTDLRAWWAEAQGVMKSVLPRGVELASDLPDGECPVNISKAALTQVVFNLVQNAGDAMKERGSGRVNVRGWCEGDSARVSVADDGPGMTKDVMARCMEPFFTTKPRAISTGLGLVLVYGLVHEARGTVELQSEPGKGTTFTLHLPLAKKSPPGASAHIRRLAVLDLSDARMRSFIAGELGSLKFDVQAFGTRLDAPAVFILDDAAKLAGLPEGARVVLLGESSGDDDPNVRVLGKKPQIAAIREAIRSMALRIGDQATSDKAPAR